MAKQTEREGRPHRTATGWGYVDTRIHSERLVALCVMGHVTWILRGASQRAGDAPIRASKSGIRRG